MKLDNGKHSLKDQFYLPKSDVKVLLDHNFFVFLGKLWLEVEVGLA
jgi:hypothetical protein